MRVPMWVGGKVAAGGSFDETIALAGSIGMPLTTQAVFGTGLSLSAESGFNETTDVNFIAAQTLAVNTAISLVETMTQQALASFAASADMPASVIAAMQLTFPLDTQAAIAPTANLTANPSLPLSADAAAVWIDTLAEIIESLTLTASISETELAALQALPGLTLAGATSVSPTTSLNAQPSLTLTADVIAAFIGTLDELIEAILFTASVSDTETATMQAVTTLTLALQAALQAQANSTMNGLVALGVDVATAQAASQGLMEAVTLQLQGVLSTTGTVQLATFGDILKIVSANLKTPSVSTETLGTVEPTNETLDG